MKEPMIRLVSLICERHGEIVRPSASARYPIEVLFTAKAMRQAIAISPCVVCFREGHPEPHPLRFATEPVE